MLPTITPRFALSCSKDLLKQLGDIAKRNDAHIQSHISENLQEIQVVNDIFKSSYAEAYDEAGLLTNKVVIRYNLRIVSDLKYFPFYRLSWHMVFI